MAGPAAYFRAQGVNGNDLMNFESEDHLRRDLAATPFLARKAFFISQGTELHEAIRKKILIIP